MRQEEDKRMVTVVGIVACCASIILCMFLRKPVYNAVKKFIDAQQPELEKKKETALKKCIEEGIITIDEVHEWEQQGLDPFIKAHERMNENWDEIKKKLQR